MNKETETSKLKREYIYPKFQQPYQSSDDNQRFREQTRFAFAATIIATDLAFPRVINNLGFWFSHILLFSAISSGFYLLMTAISLKYFEPYWSHEVFYASEKLRMSFYDIAIDIFVISGYYYLAQVLTTGFAKHFHADQYRLLVWFGFAIIEIIILLCISRFGLWNDLRSGILPKMKTDES